MKCLLNRLILLQKSWSGTCRECSPAFLLALFFAVFDAFYQYFRGVLIPVLVPQDRVKTEQLPALQRVACSGADRT